MPGYDSDRFVNLDQTYRDELTCGICHDILCVPLFVKCCGQTFCDDCITPWLKAHTNCPYDRQPMTVDKLCQPPRLVLNMLSKLEISCDFKGKGCPEVVTLDQLPHHLSRCDYNIIQCLTCLCKYQQTSASDHDCVQSLLELNQLANNDMNVVKTQMDQLMKSMQELSTSYGITITPNFGHNPVFPSLPKTSNIAANIVTENEAIINCRNQSTVIQVMDNNMSDEMTAIVMSLVSDLIHRYTSLSLICEQIVHHMNGQFGRQWLCNADFRSGSKVFWDFEPKFHIQIQLGLLHIKLFHLYFEISEEEAISTARVVSSEPLIIQNQLNPKKTQKLLSIVKTQLTDCNTVLLICKHIVQQLDQEFGLQWYCYARYRHPFQSAFSYEKGFLIELQFKTLYFQIYKTEVF